MKIEQEQIEQIKAQFKDKRHLKVMYNYFVETLIKNKVLLTSFDLIIGTSILNDKECDALGFRIDTENGFTEEEAEIIFAAYFVKYPQCHISYNKKEVSALEAALVDSSEVVLMVSGVGFSLPRI